MFRSGNEEMKNSPNPELLSLVQNLDEKPWVGGAESGPEDDALSLGAEVCNFMQPPGGRSYKTLPHVTAKTPPPMAPKIPPHTTPKTPPPVVPKPPSRGFLDGLVNRAAPSAEIPETPRLQGRGGELFAIPQSRADRNGELLKILPKEETTIPELTHEADVQEAESKAGSEGVTQVRRDQVLTSSDGNVEKMGQN
ncbi:hypothetical protein AB1E18_015101 [Capra hircus]